MSHFGVRENTKEKMTKKYMFQIIKFVIMMGWNSFILFLKNIFEDVMKKLTETFENNLE